MNKGPLRCSVNEKKELTATGGKQCLIKTEENIKKTLIPNYFLGYVCSKNSNLHLLCLLCNVFVEDIFFINKTN